MKTWHVLALVAALWAGIYLPGLGSQELKGEEARRILPGSEMLRTGDWIVPQIGGLPYTRKPPLINWLVAASIKVSGVENEWSGRMPSALIVLALAVTAAFVVARAWSAEAGLLAAIFLMTNIGFVEKGRLAEIEALFVGFFGIALLLWSGSWLRGGSAWSRWVLPYLFLGLGFLTKGPLLLLFFYVIVVAILVKGRSKKELLHPAHFLGWGVFASVILPWVLLKEKRNVEVSSSESWQAETASWLKPQEIGWDLPWLLHIPQSVMNFLPWALLLPLLWHGHTVAAIEARGERAKALFRGMRWGIVCIFILIVVNPLSRPRYTMPLMVPASILLAMAVTEVRGARRESIVRVWWWGCAVAIGGIAVTCLTIPFFHEAEKWKMLVPAAALAGAGAWMLRALVRSRERADPVRLSLFSAGFFVLVAGFFVCAVAPVMARHENVRPFAEELRATVGEDSELVIYGAGCQAFVFYLEDDEVREIGRPQDLPEDVEYLLMREALWTESEEYVTGLYGSPMETTEIINPREAAAYNRFVLHRFRRDPG